MNIFVRLFWNPLMNWNRKRLLEQYQSFNSVSAPAEILLIGDSITEEYRIEELVHHKQFVNRGISGETTSGLLGELDVVVYQLKPKKVFIQIGTNDIDMLRYNEDETVNNMEMIIKNIQQNCPNTVLYLESLYPINNTVNKPNTGKRTNEQIISLNKRYQELADKLNITFIDVYPILIGNDGLLKKEDTYDGLHITGSGYKKITELLSPYFQE